MNAMEFVRAKVQHLEAILLVRDNPQAQRMLVAWTFYRPKPSKSLEFTVHENADPGDVLNRLWALVEPIDIGRLADRADVPETKAAKIFIRLRDSGLLLPDGSLSEAAQRLLIGESEAYIRGLIKKGAYGQPKK